MIVSYFFKSDIFDISFYYPTNFFVFEDGNTINVSPFKKDNGGFQESSTGIASNLTITLRKNEPFLNNVILTQNYDSREFSEEKTTYKGLETFTQSYRGEYADEMNYIRLVNYKNISPGKSDLLYIHYTEVNKAAYSNVANAGGLPQTNCGGYPAFPEYFINPMSLKYEYNYN